MDESLYEFGNLQPATLAEPHRFGGYHWRYALVGHGQAPWATILKVLKDINYRGLLSIEMEDKDYNGTEAGEKRGLLESRDFLVGV
jgi:sugar phosphate isomerase/epimerase